MKRDMDKKKFYILDMFPYPSGNGLHVGHCLGYIGTDIYARHKKMGMNNEVFHPFGFDSFGLPTEQYAIKTGRTPQEITTENISIFKKQLSALDLDLNWEAEIITSEPKYYKWTQWIFLKLYNSWYNPITDKAEPIETCSHADKENYRLAYQASVEVNWCEELHTVLADAEVIDGKSERGGHPVERRKMFQWFLRIAPYKKRLVGGLKDVVWVGKKVQINWIQDRLHDVAFSRQRKWGEPFPIYYAESNTVGVSEDSLPVLLKYTDGCSMRIEGEREYETDTMPSFAGSNWYFFRYLDANNENFFCDKDKQSAWLPVDVYVGGAEHTTGHVLYARFITKVLFDLGLSVVDEPFKKIINVGLMKGADGSKMSKSAGNSVRPDEMIEKYGSDAFRLWISFIAPFEQEKFWKEDGLRGCAKFLVRFRRLFDNIVDEEIKEQVDMARKISNAVEKDIEKFSFNTAVPRFMTFVNEMTKQEKVCRSALVIVAFALHPFCPKLCHGLTSALAFKQVIDLVKYRKDMEVKN